jgi:hypothetical protein
MIGALRRALARFLYRLVGGLSETEAASSVATPPPASRDAGLPTEQHLIHVTEAYKEVLDATKHQDDKIGRFMAGIAFLIAGALVFTNPTVLQATYRVGDFTLPLPALALGSFLVLIVLSLLFYLLAMSAPLTIPSPTRTTSRRSHVFFLLIAGETRKSWRDFWFETASTQELEQELVDEYISETRNIALRADQKYERSNEASALFVLALLFFLLGIVLSIHVVQHLVIPSDASETVKAPTDLPWSLPLRALIGGLLAFFPVALVYQRLRAAQTQGLDALVHQTQERLRATSQQATGLRRRWAERKWNPLHALLVAYPVFVLFTLLPDEGLTRINVLASYVIGLAAFGAGLSYLRILLNPRDAVETTPGEYSGSRVIAWFVALLTWIFGAASVFAVLLDRPVEQLSIAMVAAVSPLGANLFDSSFKLNRRLRNQIG